MGNVHTSGPNECIVISGSCFHSSYKNYVIGDWAWAWWWVTDVKKLSLGVMTLNPVCEHVLTINGVPLSVTGVAQVKIVADPKILTVAAEHFLGKRKSEIKENVLQTLEGHLRAILSTLSVEEVYRDREKFANLVREIASPDLGRLGIEILSFTIKDVFDGVEYLSSLGKTQTAAVKRDANIGVALAKRDGGIREAECHKAAMDVKYATNTKIEENSKAYNLQRNQFNGEISSGKAEALMAYDLQKAKIQQKLKNEEMQIAIVARKKEIEVEHQEISRKDKELVACVRLPAEAEAFKIQTLAEGMRTKKILSAEANSEKIRLKGSAASKAIESIGMIVYFLLITLKCSVKREGRSRRNEVEGICIQAVWGCCYCVPCLGISSRACSKSFCTIGQK